MSKNTLHIIITSESGNGRTLVVKKTNLRNLTLSALLILLLLCVGTVTGLQNRKDNQILQKQVTSLTRTLHKEKTPVEERLLAETNRLQKELTSAKAELAKNQLDNLKIVDRYETEVAELKQKQDKLFEGSISRLDERSKIIKTLMDQIGVKIEVEDDPDHSGGLYVDPDSALCDKLLCKTDRYLALVQQLPFGRPIKTKISSKYGRRTDPFNQKKAFHTGIDFKGNTGDKIQATGNAVVQSSTYSKGWGNHIVLRHGNGYTTLYAHLSKRLVQRGDKVTRGQTIGLVGNTGRSTGSHLHYEVHYHKKTIDPMKFMQVAKLLARK